MKIVKQSFLSNIIGERTYNEFKGLACLCIPVATIVLVMVFILTRFFYWGFLSSILYLITGTSLIFIAYLFGVILLLDFGVEIELEETWDGRYKMPEGKPNGYIVTKLWCITLIVLAIAAIYFSNRYRIHYAFECETFLVDEDDGIYHLEDGHDEEVIYYTTEMKGYEIEKHGYSLCESCKEWAEEFEELYEYERYSRR